MRMFFRSAFVLVFIYNNQGCNGMDLVRYFDMSESTIYLILSKLRKEGLIESVGDYGRRSKRLFLTEKGRFIGMRLDEILRLMTDEEMI